MKRWLERINWSFWILVIVLLICAVLFVEFGLFLSDPRR